MAAEEADFQHLEADFARHLQLEAVFSALGAALEADLEAELEADLEADFVQIAS